MKAFNIRGSLIPGWLKLLFKEQDIFRKSSVRKCHVLIPLHIITSWYLLHETRAIAIQSPLPFQTGRKTKANRMCYCRTRSNHVTTGDLTEKVLFKHHVETENHSSAFGNSTSVRQSRIQVSSKLVAQNNKILHPIHPNRTHSSHWAAQVCWGLEFSSTHKLTSRVTNLLCPFVSVFPLSSLYL